MRFRSTSVLALNKEEYLHELEERERLLNKHHIIVELGLISLDKEDLENDDYTCLGPTSGYKATKIKVKSPHKKTKRFQLNIKHCFFRAKFIKRKRTYTNQLKKHRDSI